MELVEELLQKYNSPKRINKASTNIGQIENIINFKLPHDYKIFILNYGGFENSIGPEYVRLWDFDNLMEQNIGYQIFENLPKTLAIGGNGGGEFIAIEQIDNEILRVVLSPFIDLDRQYHIDIGSSFTNFLERLDKGQQWFK
jgi:hypothetical protein